MQLTFCSKMEFFIQFKKKRNLIKKGWWPLQKIEKNGKIFYLNISSYLAPECTKNQLRKKEDKKRLKMFYWHLNLVAPSMIYHALCVPFLSTKVKFNEILSVKVGGIFTYIHILAVFFSQNYFQVDVTLKVVFYLRENLFFSSLC